MKNRALKFFTTLSFLLVFGLVSSAQMNITTKKEKISDFTLKTTKVVLSSNGIFNQFLKDEIARRWVISSYEFCTDEEYEALKENPEFYFLLPVTSRQKKEIAPGIAELLLFKGGPEDGENARIEIVSVPYGPSEDSEGREFVYLSAIIDIIQGFTTEALVSDKTLLGGLSAYSFGKSKLGKSEIVFSEKDLAPSVLKDGSWAKKGIRVVDEDEAEEIVSDSTEDALISYTVAPSSPYKGSVCYKMLFNVRDHKLCYFSKHTISPSSGTGFLPKDIKLLLSGRK